MQFLLCLLLSAVPQWELTTSLSYVHQVSSDGNGGLWCASSGGVFHYSPSEGIGIVYSCPEVLPIPDCLDVLEDSAGRMWFATNGGGLVMYDGNDLFVYSTFEGIPGDGVVNSLLEAGGDIWVGCSGGFAHGGVNGFTPVGDAFTANDVFSISARNDTLWLCTDKGIYSLHDLVNPLNPASWKHWQDTQSLELSRISTGESSIYACGKSGVVELEAGFERFKVILDYSDSPDSSAIDVLETDKGLFAAVHGAVLRFDGENWTGYGSGIPMVFWPSCLFEVQGTLHAGFSYQTNILDLLNTQAGLGFYILEGEYWNNFPIPGLQCKRIHQMASMDDGRLYAATYLRGVQAYYPGYGWRSYVESDGMPNGFQTFALAADPEDGIWASSYHHGLSWIRDNQDWTGDGDTILTFIRDSLESSSPQATLIKADIPNNQPVMIAGQSNGMWAAFRQYDPTGQPDEPSGILGYNGDPMGVMNWAPRLGGSGIAAINVRSVYPVSGDSLWIAFDAGAGCQLLVHSGNPSDDSEDSWLPGPGQAFTTAYGLPTGEVFCFQKVPGVGLLAGTSDGLTRWTGNGFNDYADISGAVKAMTTDSEGRIWCLGESGIYRVSDGEATFFNGLNSDFKPSALYTREYSTRDQVSGGVYFSAEAGLWLVTQSGGGGSQQSGISFYPQPYLSGEGVLRFTGAPDGLPVSVDFFRLDGSFAGTVEGPSMSEWAWDGSLRGKIVAGGVYMALVTVGESTHQARIAVVR